MIKVVDRVRILKTCTALLLVFIISGCGGTTRQSYSVQELRAIPEWRLLAKRLLTYQHLVCETCRPDAWQLGIVKSEKVNAFNMGGGKFFVTEGLLRIPFEQQDAALAHEVGHEVSGHVGIRQTASIATTAVFVVIGAIIPGAGLLNHVINPMVMAAFSKEQELEADSIAVFLLQSSHEDKRAAKRLQDLLERFSGREGSSKGGLFATHPHPDERIAQVEKILRGEKQPKRPPAYSPPWFAPAEAEEDNSQ